MTNTIYVRPVYIDEDSIEGSETASPARDHNGVDQTTNRLETRVNFARMNFFAAASRSLNKLESILDMVQGVWSDNFEFQLKSTTQFKKFSSSKSFDRIDKVIKACVVPRFVEFLESQDLPQLQYEAALALTNIDDVSQQAVPSFRDLVVGQGALLPLLSQFNEHSKLSMVRNATKTLYNLQPQLVT